MSHQGLEGWFPECLICGCGNLGAIVCLDPTCHELSIGRVIPPGADSPLRIRDSHHWKDCHFCLRCVRSDGGAFGTYALCSDCWNRFAQNKMLPPTSPRDLNTVAK